MSVSMLIILMLADQKSYDQFHTNKDRIYRILCDKPDNRHPYATSPDPLAGALRTDYPAIAMATCLRMGVGGDALYNQKSAEMRGFFADTSFFSVFSFELGKGDRTTALTAPGAMVISSKIARQLFGEEDPIGKTIAFSDRGLSYFGDNEASAPTPWGSYTITGVLADKQYKSHLKFDVLLSAASLKALSLQNKVADLGNDWSDYYRCYTYALMAPGKNSRDLDGALRQLATRKYAGLKDFSGFSFSGQELSHISPGILLGNEPILGLPLVVYYFLSVLALIIMASACLNYINLSTARALTRAKEIGVRKVTGAGRKDLVIQFLSEAILTALLAAVMATLILFFVRSAFLNLWVNKYLNFDLRGGLSVYFIFAGFALAIGLIAGIYPALYLSKFQPIRALKNGDQMGLGKLSRRKVLSVFQFVVSLVFIITSILLFHQFRHVLEFKYEFSSGNIVNISLQGNDYRLVEKEFGEIPGVSGISACQYVPVTGRNEGVSLKKLGGSDKNDRQDFSNFTLLPVDEHFIKNMDLRMLAGRDLPPAGKSSERVIVVNEAAVKMFGYKYPAEIIGQAFKGNYDDTAFSVIGVVQDFHIQSAMEQEKIGPMVLMNQPGTFQYANVKIAGSGLRDGLARLAARWKTIDPVHPF
jgi:putative ABC transport system permease protein